MLAWLVVLPSSPAAEAHPTEPRVLRIASDPNNLPFSNDRLAGFENKIANLIARELNATIQYTWRAQRRGFFRETLKQGDADLVMGIPAQSHLALTTQPYYRSGYVLVFSKTRGPKVRSLDDPALRKLRVGVPLAGDSAGNTPPVHALASRGMITNVIPFTVYGNYATENPPARILDAVAAGEIDVAVVWGPLGGYFANKTSPALDVTFLPPEPDSSGQPLEFDISIGVTKKKPALRDEINAALIRCHAEIEQILNDFNIPRRPLQPPHATPASHAQAK